MFRANDVRIFIEANGSKTGSVDVTQFTVALLDVSFAALTSFTFDVPPTLWGITGYIELDAIGSETLPSHRAFILFGNKWCRNQGQRFWMQCPEHTTLSGNSSIFKYPDTFWRRNFRQVHPVAHHRWRWLHHRVYRPAFNQAYAQAHKSFTVFEWNGFCRTDLRGHYPYLHSESG